MHDIAEFLRGCDPFSGLDEEALEQLAQRTEVEYFAAGTTILSQGARSQGKVRVVRRGAVELLDRGRLVDMLGEGEMFGHPSLLSGQPTGFEVRAAEDTLSYAIAAEDAMPVLARPAGLRFLGRSILQRPRPTGPDGRELTAPDISKQAARSLIRRQPVICDPQTKLSEAARRMGEEGASSVLVRTGNGELGIVTDSDIRLR
ncbi:MAG TPA: cyclic nucleotide-binding domain-containing protein, partial [Solirubrobacterales bacterium]|nr:cyclic nucleotide-binding domain-containing protein [Solirubrobacterales bacterium]